MRPRSLLFEMDPSALGPTPRVATPAAAKKENEAKRSISYVMGAVLEFGKVSGFSTSLIGSRRSALRPGTHLSMRC